MENSADILELSRKRLQSLFSDNSLKQNVIETIIASFNSSTSLNDQNGLDARISPALREELLQEVLRRIKCPKKFEKLARVVPFLLSSMTKNLDLNVLYPQISYDYVDLYYIDEVLFMAGHLAPNLERLSYKNRGMLTDNDDAEIYALLSLFVTNFRHLRILEMQNFSADLHDLVFLCGNLPSLRVVKLSSVHYEFSPSCAEDISMPLCNLRLLVIEAMEISRRAIDIIGQRVPNLDIIDDLKQTGLSFDDFLLPEGDPNLSQRKIFTLDRFWFEHPDAEIHERHPNIAHLQVEGHDALGFSLANLSLPNFTKVSSISIETANQEITAFLIQLASRLLEKYGQNLRSVSLQLGDSNDEPYDIESLLKFCPNIERLLLDGLDASESPEELNNVPHLKELSWVAYGGFVPNVFLLPKLQKLELTCLYPGFSEEELEIAELIATLVAEKHILLELECLRIDFSLGDLSVVAFRSITKMIQNASAFLPKLTDLELSCDHLEYVALARRMKESDSFKANFFSDQAFDADVPDVFVDEQLIETLALYQNYN